MALSIPTAWALWRVAASLFVEEDVSSFHGARLGMTPADVREHLDMGDGLKAFSLPDGSYALSLEPTHSDRTVRSARFEFHLGLLVAIRADLSADDPAAQGAPLIATSGAVRHLERTDGGYRMTLIARSCPTHAEEVRELLQDLPTTVP